MPDPATPHAYRLFEREPDLETLRTNFEWQVPDPFNLATYLCDRWMSANRTAVFLDHAERSNQTYSFAELSEVSARLAGLLSTAGVDRGDRIAVCGSQQVEVLASHLAAWKLGAVSVPLSLLLGPDGLSHRLDDAGATALIAHDSMTEPVSTIRSELDALETVVHFGPGRAPEGWLDWAELDEIDAAMTTAQTSPSDPAIINYTSGTTGDPKGVVHGHEHVLGTLPTFVMSKLNMTAPADDVNRTIVEWSWTGAFNNTVMPSLFYGVPVVGAVGRQFDPADELDLIERYGVTIFNCPPTALRMLRDASVDLDDWDLRSVRRIATGGEAVDADLVDWAREAFPAAVVHEVYGQTEAPTFLGDCVRLDIDHRDGRMGQPSIGHEVRVVDPDDPPRAVDVGEVGELALRTRDDPVCFQSYWNRPAATEGKVVDGWLLTEDLVRADGDGYYAFVSRKDDVIISSGYRISPAEIEQCLTDHDRVRQAGVVGKPHESRGTIPKAFVVLDDEPVTDADRLRSTLKTHVKSTLAKYEYPREIEFVDAIETTTSGKVKRDALEDRLDETA